MEDVTLPYLHSIHLTSSARVLGPIFGAKLLRVNDGWMSHILRRKTASFWLELLSPVSFICYSSSSRLVDTIDDKRFLLAASSDPIQSLGFCWYLIPNATHRHKTICLDILGKGKVALIMIHYLQSAKSWLPPFFGPRKVEPNQLLSLRFRFQLEIFIHKPHFFSFYFVLFRPRVD